MMLNDATIKEHLYIGYASLEGENTGILKIQTFR